MNSGFFQKTPGFAAKLSERKKKGTMLILTVFMFSVFSILALGMVILSQVHLRLSGFRKSSVQLDYAAENGIKAGFHELMKAIAGVPLLQTISEEKYREYHDRTESGEVRIVEETLGLRLPVEIQENGDLLLWRSLTDSLLERMDEKEDSFLAHFKIFINSEGRIKNFRPKRTSALESKVGLLAGHIPLSLIPFLIDKRLSSEERESYQRQNNIAFIPSAGNLIPPQISSADEKLIPQEAGGLLAKALDLKIFRPQDLSSARLREVLGLEASDDPVPEGVYLIANDLGLGGIYIQGDVEEMVTAIEEDFQVVSFRLAAGSWVLKFSPSRSLTYFFSPQGRQSFELVPLGIIIVDGRINSLGGGVVDSDGRIRLVKDEEISSLLTGVNLTIVASEKITISSHLIRQGVTWKEGVPYVKEENAQLFIFSTGKDFWEDEARAGGIAISEGAPLETKLHAVLTAQSEGFAILGENKTVHLLGSLQVTDYLPQKNKLEMTLLPFPSDLLELTPDVPLTENTVLFLAFFETVEWREF